jgi:hypothetical protein
LKGSQQYEGPDGKLHDTVFKFCTKRLSGIESDFAALQGKHNRAGTVYFFDVSTECPDVIIVDGDGMNYVSVDSESGEILEYYPQRRASEAFKELLNTHELDVSSQADAIKLAKIFLKLQAQDGWLVSSESQLRKLVSEDTEHRDYPDPGMFKQWWAQYDSSLSGMAFSDASTGVNSFQITLTTWKVPDFVLLGDYFDVPRIERWQFSIGNKGEFEYKKTIPFPRKHIWFPNRYKKADEKNL